MRPYLGIWGDPRTTFREMTPKWGTLHFLFLAPAYGVSMNLRQVVKFGIAPGTEVTAARVVLTNLASGAVFGVCVLCVLALVVVLVLRLMHEQCSARDVRTVLAWSSLPYGIQVVVMVPVLLWFGDPVFLRREAAGGLQGLPLVGGIYYVLGLIASIWGICIGTVGLSEKAAISNGRSFLALFLAATIVVVVVTGAAMLWFSMHRVLG